MFSYEYLVEESIDKVKTRLICYWTVVIIFIIGIFFSAFVRNIYNYFEFTGIVTADNQVIIIIPIENIHDVMNNNKITIDRNSFDYKLSSIDSEIVYNDGIMIKKVILDIPLMKKNMENNIINLKIEKENKKFFDEILKYWRGKI